MNVHYVDTIGIAENEVGNGKTANMVMLGAMLRTCDIVNLETIDKTLEYVMSGKKVSLIPANKQAIMVWKEDASGNDSGARVLKGYDLCMEVSNCLGIPLAGTTCRENLLASLLEDLDRPVPEIIFPIDLYMRPSWLDR